MTRSLKKKPKGLVIDALNALVERGRVMVEAPADDIMALAGLMVDKLEWTLAVLTELPQMSRSVQVLADFNRASALGKAGLCESFEEERDAFRRQLKVQVNVLAKAVERWSKSGTHPLK